MEKKILKEINEIRNIMGLPLLIEQPTTVDMLTSFLSKVGKNADDKILTKVDGKVLNKTTKEIYNQFIVGFKSKMPKADRDLAIKFFQTKEGKNFIKSYKNAIDEFAAGGGDPSSVASHKGRLSRIETAVNTTPTPSSSSTSGLGSVSSGKYTRSLSDLDIAAQEIWLPNYAEAKAKLKIAFPKAPTGKYNELINVIKLGKPKNEQDFIRKFESIISDYRGPYAEYLQKKANRVGIMSYLWQNWSKLDWKVKTAISLVGFGLAAEYGFDISGAITRMLELGKKGGVEVVSGVGGVISPSDKETDVSSLPTSGGEYVTPPPSRETPPPSDTRRDEVRPPKPKRGRFN